MTDLLLAGTIGLALGFGLALAVAHVLAPAARRLEDLRRRELHRAGYVAGLRMAALCAREFARRARIGPEAVTVLVRLARATETGADDVTRAAVEHATPDELAALCRARGASLAAITPRLPTDPETR